MERREFIKGSAWMGAFAALSGCCAGRLGFGAGGSMYGFVEKPMKRVRVGILGVGNRGIGAVHRIAMVPGCEVTAICDKKQERLDLAAAWFAKEKIRAPRAFCGEEAWKAVTDGDLCDVVYICTPWQFHTPQAVWAMENGKIALCEIPCAMTVEDCWRLVETCERTRRPCMVLENCCYGEVELLGIRLAHSGRLGEIVHGEGGYIHDLRKICATDWVGEHEWRYDWNRDHVGNLYPNHGILPLMQAMDVNRGDCFDYLVSLDSKEASRSAYIRARLPADHPRQSDVLQGGNMNLTLIRTRGGKSILLNHDICSPRPYSRTNLLSGTKGIFWGMPWRRPGGVNDLFQIGFEEELGKGIHDFLPREAAEKFRVEHGSPIWKKAGQLAKTVGGHGGQDFIMDLRWAYCLQNGIPLDLDVYDAAASSCLCELTERSVRNRSRTEDIPDFTRGAWRTMAPVGEIDVDLAKLDLRRARKDEAQIAI